MTRYWLHSCLFVLVTQVFTHELRDLTSVLHAIHNAVNRGAAKALAKSGASCSVLRYICSCKSHKDDQSKLSSGQINNCGIATETVSSSEPVLCMFVCKAKMY